METTHQGESKMDTQTKLDVFLNGDISRFQYLEIVDEDLAFEVDGPCIPISKVLTAALTYNLERYAGSMEAEEEASETQQQIWEQDAKVNFAQLRELYTDIEWMMEEAPTWIEDNMIAEVCARNEAHLDNMVNFAIRSTNKSCNAALKKIRKIINSQNVRLDG
jgi:hypothetical protein